MLDFSNSIAGHGFTAYKMVDQEQLISVIPDRLQIFLNHDGVPAFRLEAVRGITPFSKPEPYGVFEIQLSPAELSEEIISQIKGQWPTANLKTPVFNRGYLGLSLIGEEGESLSDELEIPVPLSQMPLSKMRFIRRTSMEYLGLLKDALHKELLMLRGFGFFSITGYSPRVPVTLNFNPAELTQHFISVSGVLINEITYSALEEYFSEPLSDLPVELLSDSEQDSDQISEILTDWYIHRFCTVQSPSVTDQDVHFLLNEDAESEGSFTWNLNEELAVVRHTFFTLDAIEEARRVVKDRGIDEVFTTRIVEPIKTGFLRVEVFHPFFQIPIGIRQIGIKILVSANAPLRPQAIQKTVVFDAGQDLHSVTLQFSPAEEQIYQVLPFAIYGDSSGTREILGDQFEISDQELVIEQEAYPLFFASFIYSVNLRSQASLVLTIRKKGEEDLFFDPVLLTPEHPSTMVSVPLAESSDFECHITAKSLSTIEEVRAVIPILGDYKIDLTTFKEYGSHEVLLKMDVTDGKAVGIDLIPESAELNPSKITTVAFTVDKKEILWSWFSPSVFQSGFRYRFHDTPGNEWSEVQSPFCGELTLEHMHAPI